MIRRPARLLLLCLVALLALAPVTLPASAGRSLLIADNLIAHWKLNEASGTRLDETNNCGGSGCDLTDNNTVTQNPGKIGNAAQFTSANSEYLSLADTADISTGDISFTWALWAYFDSLTGERWLIGKLFNDTTREYVIRINAAGSTRMEASMSSGGSNFNLVANSFGNLSTATWYFVVMTYNAATDTMTLCVNDVCDSLGSVPGPSDTAGVLNFGRQATTADKYFGGRLDSVTFWKRAISSTERTCLYNAGSGLDYSFATCDPTPTPTNTSTATNTSTSTITPTPTNTSTSTSTSTSTTTSTSTITPTPTNTVPGPTDTPTKTPTASNTPTATATETLGPSPTPTETLVPSDTPTVTNTPLLTNTPTPTITPTPTHDINIWYQLDSGNWVLIERRGSFGELAMTLAAVVLVAWNGLRWLYQLAEKLLG